MKILSLASAPQWGPAIYLSNTRQLWHEHFCISGVVVHQHLKPFMAFLQAVKTLLPTDQLKCGAVIELPEENG